MFKFVSGLLGSNEDAAPPPEHPLLSSAECAVVNALFDGASSPETHRIDLNRVQTLLVSKGLPLSIAQRFVVFLWSVIEASDSKASRHNHRRAWLHCAAVAAKGDWNMRSEMFRESHPMNASEDCGLALALACDLVSGLALFSNSRDSHEDPSRLARFLVTQGGSQVSRSMDTLFDDNPDETRIPRLSLIASWAPHCSLFNNLWIALFQSVLLDELPLADSMIPVIANPSNEQLLLSTHDLFVLSSYVKKHGQQRSIPLSNAPECWSLLYSTESNGKSWGSLTAKIEAAGSVLLVLRDSEGHVFGAYSPVPLECSPRFTGNSEAFLFRLQPELHVYPDAGVNSNYVYFNYGTSTLPNGIGFGGQMNYFGLWIDSSFTFGSCAASPRSTTFNSPRLNSPVSSLPSPKFEIDAMHVYLVHPKEVDDRLVPERVKRGGRGSILNSHPIESALLEMAGKERYAV